MIATQAGSYVLERSHDLNTWEYVDEMQCAEQELMEFHDKQTMPATGPSKPRMFYRIGLRPKPLTN